MLEAIRLDRSGSTDEITQRHHEYLLDGHQTPWNQLREMMDLSSAYSFNQESVPQLMWLDEGGESMIIDETRIDLMDLQMAVQNGIQATRQ